MKRIAFHDREREMGEIMKILDSEPSLITFVYGPINSGKTTVISHLIKELPEEYAPFYVNLRGRFIADYEDTGLRAVPDHLHLRTDQQRQDHDDQSSD